jgi:inner membrane protein
VLAARVLTPVAPQRGLDTVARPGLAACLLVGLLAGAFPDIDSLLGLLSPIAYLVGHRGVTHSLVLLPLWAALLAWVFSGFGRRRDCIRPFFIISAAALAVHVLGDLITAFGTMLFEPISDRRFALSATFIIDLWFSGIALAGVLATVLLPRWRLPSVVALAALCGYVGFSSVQHERALDVGLARAAATGWSGATVSAVPRPVSPFNWMVVIEDGERYEHAQVNLRRAEPVVAGEGAGFIRRLDAAYRPVAQASWAPATRFGLDADAREIAQAVWDHPDFAVMRWFYALPALHAIQRAGGEQCAWFQDLRFSVPARASVPFRYGMCRASPSAPWQRFEMVGEDGRRPL